MFQIADNGEKMDINKFHNFWHLAFDPNPHSSRPKKLATNGEKSWLKKVWGIEGVNRKLANNWSNKEKKKNSQEGKLIEIENQRKTSIQSIQEDNHKKTGGRPYRRKPLQEFNLTGS